jgi:hypothetical protein
VLYAQLQPVENLLDFFDELGERGRRKGEKEGDKGDPS